MADPIEKQKSASQLTRSPRIQRLAARARRIGLERQLRKSQALQVCFLFDTTGSMYGVFEEGKRAIKEIVTAISVQNEETKLAFVAYKNHGDESYFDRERAFTATPWTSRPEDIRSLMDRVPNGGGGDGITCLEDVLHYLATEVEWINNSAKVIVLVGDMPPHGVVDSVTRCPGRIDYREAVAGFRTRGIIVYTIHCDTDERRFSAICSPSRSSLLRKQKIKDFYHWISGETGGQCFSLEDVQLLITILVGICMKETNRLDEFEEMLKARKALGPRTQKILAALKAEN